MPSVTIKRFQEKNRNVEFHTQYPKNPPVNPSLKIKFLGTAGFVFQSKNRTIVADPYLNRTTLRSVIRNTSYDPTFYEPGTFAGEIPIDVGTYIPEADDVIIGHSHYDHLLDAPDLCLKKEARLIGSKTTIWIARAAWEERGAIIPEDRIIPTQGNESIPCGDHAEVWGIPSNHAPQVDGILQGALPAARAALGTLGNWQPPPWRTDNNYYDRKNGLLFPGVISDEEGPNVTWPLNAIDFKVGEVLDWHIKIGGHNIIHIDSADYIASEYQNKRLKANILCLCAVGWNKRRQDQKEKNYIQFMLDRFQPDYVIPCHWDRMFDPFPNPGEARVWGQANLEEFVVELEKHKGQANVIWLDVGGEMIL